MGICRDKPIFCSTGSLITEMFNPSFLNTNYLFPLISGNTDISLREKECICWNLPLSLLLLECICIIHHPWLSSHHNVKWHAYFQLGTQRSNQLFRAEYNAITNEEAFYNGQGQSLLSVSYKSGLLPTQWSYSREAGNSNCSQTFDR